MGDWEKKYHALHEEHERLKETYMDFQTSSHEFENELEEELAQSQMECDRLKSRLSRTEGQLRKARDEADLQRKQTSEEIATLQERVQGGKGGGDLKQLQTLLQEKNDVERRAADEIGYVREELEQVREQNEHLLTEIDEMRDQYEDIVNSLKHELRDAKADLLKKGGSGGGAGGSADKYADIIDSLKEELSEYSDKVMQLNQDKDQLEARLLEESELNEELTGEVSDLTDDFMANSDRIEELEMKLKEAEDKLANLPPPEVVKVEVKVPVPAKPDPKDADKTASKTELDGVKAQLEGYVAKANELQAKYTESAGLALQAGRDLDSAKSEISQLQTHLEGAKADLADAQRQSREAADRLKIVTAERDEAKDRVAELENQIANNKARLEKAEKDAESALAKAEEIESGVAEQARAGQERVMQLQREKDDLARQLEELEELKEELGDAAEKAAAAKAETEAKIERERLLKAKLREEKAEVQNEALKKYKGGPGGKVVATLGGLRGVMTGMARDVEGGTKFLNDGFSQLRSSFEEVAKVLKSAKANYKKEVEARKKLFDEVQDVKGNIKVYCRVRPLLKHEVKAKVEECLEFPGNNQIAISREIDDKIGKKGSSTFQFDRVYTSMQDQREVFEDVQNLCLSVLDGYKVCIFAYGQTGSGKTFTMEGPKENRGINFRACAAIFRQAKKMAPQWSFKAHVSIVEIYNEKLADLLDSESVREMASGLEEYEENESLADESKKKKTTKKKKSKKGGADEDDDMNDGGKLEIRKGPHGMYVHGLKTLPVRSAEEVMEVMALGNTNRQTASTNANAHSSRSHSILIVNVDGVDNVTQNKVHGRLQLIDLAGSERVANTGSSGQRLVEATYINKSLSALGDVMTALSSSKKDKHVPFRNSKLTYMLQDSLGGNSKTMMFVNCSPAAPSAQETLCSLQFAKRVRLVKLDASAHQENAALDKYKQKAEALKEELKQEQRAALHTQSRYEEKMTEKDSIINDLNAQIRAKQQALHQTELAAKKEMGDLQSELNRLQRGGGSSSGSSDKLAKKLQTLQEKYDHVQTLLKHSQRENKKLKEAEKRADKLQGDLQKAKQATAKAHELEKTLDAVERKARAEELGRKRAEANNSGISEEEMNKKLEDKEQIIKVLRSKNRKLTQEVLAQKASKQHAALLSPRGGADSGDSKARLKARLAELRASSKFFDLNERSKLNVPKEWNLAGQLGNITTMLAK